MSTFITRRAFLRGLILAPFVAPTIINALSAAPRYIVGVDPALSHSDGSSMALFFRQSGKTATRIEFMNGSTITCGPTSSDAVRSYSYTHYHP